MVFAVVCVSCANCEQTIPSDDTTTNSDIVTDAATTKPTLSDSEISAIINENLDLLMAVGDDLFSEQEYIDANPEAFERIVELGEKALPHLEEISEKCYTYAAN